MDGHDHAHETTPAGAAPATVLAPCPPDGCQGLTPPPRPLGTLVLSLGIVAALMGVQLVGYFFTRSLVIAFDALHMFVDMGAIGLALFAAWISRRPATAARTFGYLRAEILASLANGAALVAITLLLAKEAWERLAHPEIAPELKPSLMMLFGGIGLVANIANAFILHRGGLAHSHGEEDDHDHDHDDQDHDDHDHDHDEAPAKHADAHHDLNLQGAFLHVLGDVLGSFGAVVAGAIIYFTSWSSADAVIAAVMSLFILARDVLLMLRAIDVLLESTPKHVDVVAFDAALRRVEAIREIHDLHIWTLTSGVYAMSCHATVNKGTDHRRVLAQLTTVIRDRFGIDHTTIQLEEPEDVAATASSSP